MRRCYAALRLAFFDPPDQQQLDVLIAALDDFRPTALEDVPGGVLAFFADAAARDAALEHFGARELLDVTAEDIADENWAARSQAALTPVTVGGLTISPPWAATEELRATASGPVIVIQPSMGFGTGHHASTRLCLSLLQQIPLEGRRVLDVGTGSGVLAIAARLLGAAEVTGVDNDPDALANARENLALNPTVWGVDFRELDLASVSDEITHRYDVILANLTGALLAREAERLTALASPAATLIASGFQTDDAPAVLAAFRALGWRVAAERTEETWVGARLEPAG